MLSELRGGSVGRVVVVLVMALLLASCQATTLDPDVVVFGLGPVSDETPEEGDARAEVVEGIPEEEASELEDPPMDLVEGNTEFAIALHQRMAEEDANLVHSPFSVSNALAMAYVGARGETAEQMEEALRFSGVDSLHEDFGELVRYLRQRGARAEYELTIANALWGQEGYEFLPEFLGVLESTYEAPLREVDYGDSYAAAEQVNAWVDKQTRGKISEILHPGAINPELTRLVLTNAIYFKGDWAEQFNEDRTQTEPFTRPDGEIVDVEMMRQTERFPYAEFEGGQVLELPYEGDDLSMLVLLPEAHDGLPALEDELSARQLRERTEELERRKVNVKLPRFDFSSTVDLKTLLEAMGMEDAFSLGAADFTGMTDEADADLLFISEALQKALVEVDEEGTVAAAATMVGGLAGALIQEPVYFHADRPFLFLIRDRETESILFMGRVANPGI